MPGLVVIEHSGVDCQDTAAHSHADGHASIAAAGSSQADAVRQALVEAESVGAIGNSVHPPEPSLSRATASSSEALAASALADLSTALVAGSTTSSDPTPANKPTKEKEPPSLPAAKPPSLPKSACNGISIKTLHEFAEKTNLKKKDSLMALKAIKPSNKSKARKPPIHWLATGDWMETAYNLRYFYRNLSKAQQDLEWEKYNRLPQKEQRNYAKIVAVMMEKENRVIRAKKPAPKPSRPLSERHANQQKAQADHQATQADHQQLNELIAHGSERMGSQTILDAAEQIKANKTTTKKKGRKKKQQPQKVKAKKHVGLGSKKDERDKIHQARIENQKNNPRRKYGENATSVGSQFDSKAKASAHRSMRSVADAIDTCLYPDRKSNQPANRILMIQLIQGVDSQASGGFHSGRSLEKAKLILTCQSKDDAQFICHALGKTIGPSVTKESALCDIQWVTSSGGMSIKESVEDIIAVELAPRKRPPKKRKAANKVQNDEDTNNYTVMMPAHN